MKSLFFLIVFLIASIDRCVPVDFVYHNYNQLVSLLRDYSSRFPNKTHLYSVGKSALGRDLWVLALSDRNPDRHELLRPEAKYIGNMHGNESPNRELLIQLIDYMITNQSNDQSVDFLMKNTRVHILPTMNPDGFERSFVSDCTSVQGRFNSNGYDLNRNFPDHFETNFAPIQPETRAIMSWLAANEFVVSANMHEGSLVVNYPYDNYKYSMGLSATSLCDDDDVFRVMSLNYTANNSGMRASDIVCNQGDDFVNGTTNGGFKTFEY